MVVAAGNDGTNLDNPMFDSESPDNLEPPNPIINRTITAEVRAFVRGLSHDGG